jgi:hypothetical protein
VAGTHAGGSLAALDGLSALSDPFYAIQNEPGPASIAAVVVVSGNLAGSSGTRKGGEDEGTELKKGVCFLFFFLVFWWWGR